MRLVTFVCCLAIIAGARPAVASPGRVAVVDLEKLWEAGGIHRWLVARQRLDGERAKFKVAEKPASVKPSYVPAECSKPPKYLVDLCRQWQEKQREGIVNDTWTEHERSVLDPIEADVQKELERYATATGIDILLDRGALGENLVFVGRGADITAAFVKRYNASHK